MSSILGKGKRGLSELDIDSPYAKPEKKCKPERSLSAPERVSMPVSVSAPKPEDGESFLSLLESFAQLTTSEHDPQQPERCPVCDTDMPWVEFAEHVFDCVKKLDSVEREHVARLDERMAHRLAEFKDGLPVDYELSASFRPPARCLSGTSCRRMDAQHFMAQWHPPATCPICEQEFAVYEADAHITLCMSSGSAANSQSIHRSPAVGSVASMDTSDALHKHKQQGRPRLSRAQISAMAKLVLKCNKSAHKASASAGDVDGHGTNTNGLVDDPSLSELLDTFKTLGFTKENLQRELERDV